MNATTMKGSHPSYRPLGRMPMFKPGKLAYLHGREATISYIHLRKGELLVHLQGHSNAVPADHLELAPTELVWPDDRLEAHAYRLQSNEEGKAPSGQAQDTAGTDGVFNQATGLAVIDHKMETTDDIFENAAAPAQP